MSAYASIEELRSQLGATSKPVSDEYRAKMLHELPPAKTVDRAKFILERCAGKCVLEFGASGPMHDAIVKVAKECRGVDRQNGVGVIGFDLDAVGFDYLPDMAPGDPDVIICGEVLEHLSNPGWFLERLRKQFPEVPVVITVPNAFSSAGKAWLAKGLENVNGDHVAWYSPNTLRVLLARAGYTAAALYYYNGDGPTAEGLIVETHHAAVR